MKKKILILVSILVVFLAIPPFVNYWVSTPSPIGFIPIEKQEVWISFYASLIGSGITLLGVALTICYTDFTRKEDFRKHEQELKEEYEKRNNDTKINLSAQYKPILTVTFDSNYIDDIKSTIDKELSEVIFINANKDDVKQAQKENKTLGQYKLQNVASLSELEKYINDVNYNKLDKFVLTNSDLIKNSTHMRQQIKNKRLNDKDDEDDDDDQEDENDDD